MKQVLSKDIKDILSQIKKYREVNNTPVDEKVRPLHELELALLPKIPTDWAWLTSNDISTFITNGVHSPTSENDELGINKRMLRITDIQDSGVAKFTSLPYCKRFVKGDYDKTLKRNDIYISFTGNVLGKKYIVREDNDGVVFAHYFVRWKPIVVIPKFIYYILQSRYFDDFIEAYKLGSAQPNLKVTDLKRVPLPIAPIKEQKAIAHILGSLDDKIELNRQMNETLESMAQALFKSWFVDFDPVIDNALAAGNPIPDVFAERAEQRRELKANTEKPSKSGGVSFNASENSHQSLFPSEFEYTEEMGWIPKGWGIKKISDLVNTISETFPLKTVDKVVFLNTGDIQEGRFLHQNYSDSQGLPGQAKKSIKENDILYSEIRPKNKRYAYVNFDTADYVVSTKLMVLRSTGEVKSLFTYFVLTQDDKVEYLQTMAESRSGTFPQITFDVLSKITLALPKKPELIDRFMLEVLEPNFNKMNQNRINSTSLEKLRDTLLPKLLSGEIRIHDAEKLIKEIGV